MRIGIQTFQDSLKLVGGAIEVECVRGADENVDLALADWGRAGPSRRSTICARS